MPNKGKKLFPVCYNARLFSFCILSIIVITNIIYLMDISRYCPPLLDDRPLKNIDVENPPGAIFERLVNQTQDIVAVKMPIKVSIGTVVCHEEDDLSPREKALVLLKLTNEGDKEYFAHNILPFTKMEREIQVDFHFYSIFDFVPKEHQNLVFPPGLRCTYVRIFFPTGLPKVDSILYLDTDVIITGNVAEIWNTFDKMVDYQLVGAVMDIEPDNVPWYGIHKDAFPNTPVPTRRGLNAGVLFMNLTRMRKYQFGDKMLRLYKDYMIFKNDQLLLNTLLYYNPYLLYLLPCQYNFRPAACNLGFYCRKALADPGGVQILHNYQKSNILGTDNAFRDIAEAYQKVTELGIDLRTNLLVKVRDMYKTGYKSVYDHGKCDGILNNILFKTFFVSN